VRVIAVDWSGRRVGAERAIAIAECSDDGLRLIGKGRDRAETTAYLIDRAADDPRIVVGLDFSFSAPAWFVEQVSARDGPGFWEIVAGRGEGWLGGAPALADSRSPFFGRAGTNRPEGVAIHRRTEAKLASELGLTPKSFFQTGGAGAVGTMSIRGMPHLSRLAEAGFRIWPFHDPTSGHPTVVEIYPRALTRLTGKRDPESCRRVLSDLREELGSDLVDPDLVDEAARDDDLFDAAVSAIVMWQNAEALTRLPASNEMGRTEGAIWVPRPGAVAPAPPPAG
jgi:hypothetical protein